MAFMYGTFSLHDSHYTERSTRRNVTLCNIFRYILQHHDGLVYILYQIWCSFVLDTMVQAH